MSWTWWAERGDSAFLAERAAYFESPVVGKEEAEERGLR